MAVTLDLEPRPVPLVRSEDGVYRVTESRLPLERIVEHYKAGATPEVEFPTKSRHGVNGYSACSYSAGETYPSEECRRWTL